MVLRALADSPPDYAENLRVLQRIERQLRLPRSTADNNSTCDNNDEDEWSFAPPAERAARELWGLVLDVVCSPLWLRIRAAELLNACCVGDQDEDDEDEAGTGTVGSKLLRVKPRDAYRLRAIVSSTCQALEELDASQEQQAAQLFTWFAFLEHVLLATSNDVCARVFQNTMYVGMLTKMLRLLSACSTKLFAATTVCLALFHAHEQRSRHSVLVGEVLRDPKKEGRQHLGGALLHVINSCGCPCPPARLVHLRNALQLFGDVLADKAASELVFVNDFKVLVDLVIRECTDLPQEDLTRLHYLVLLERMLHSPLYVQTQLYRKHELWKLLEALLDAGAEEDSHMPETVVQTLNQILMQYIDLLD